MQTNPLMNEYNINEFERKQYVQINFLLLAIHVIFAIPLFFLSPKHLFIVNIISISFYLIGFLFINKNRKVAIIYLHLILLEILVFIASTTLVFGWDCGIHLWMFALLCTFMKDYINPGQNAKKRAIYITNITCLFFIEYISLYLITRYFDFPFKDPLPQKYIIFMMILNSFLTFLGIITFTRIYTRQMEIKFRALHNQADYDQLTGLGNRYYMHAVLNEEEKVCTRHPNLYFSVAMIDIDHFKEVNDTYGHDNGDMILKRIATILTRYSSDNLFICRWGGEEFLLMANHNIAYEEFLSYLDAIRIDVSEHKFLLKNTMVQCTVSLGAAIFKPNMNVRTVLKQADNNLYVAKEQGRNRLIK